MAQLLVSFGSSIYSFGLLVVFFQLFVRKIFIKFYNKSRKHVVSYTSTYGSAHLLSALADNAITRK